MDDEPRLEPNGIFNRKKESVSEASPATKKGADMKLFVVFDRRFILSFILLFGVGLHALSAGTIEVTNTNPTGKGSLVEALTMHLSAIRFLST